MATHQDGDGIDGIRRQTGRRRLLHPTDLAKKVSRCESRARARDAVLGQVALARDQSKSSWIASVARELNAARFESRGWVDRHVRGRSEEKARPSQDGPSDNRDIRLKANPDLPRVVVDMGKGASTETTAGDEMDIDPDLEEKLLASPIKDKPAAEQEKSKEAKSYAAKVKEGTVRARDSSDVRQPMHKRPRVERTERQARHGPETCPVQGCGAAQSMSHALNHHVPAVFHTALSGEDVTNRRVGALKLAARWLLGQKASLADLIRYLDSTGANREIMEPDTGMVQAMGELCACLQLEEPEDFTVRRSRNHVAALVHWKVLLNLASLLEGRQCQELRDLFDVGEEERQLLPTLPVAFDSHCHLDRTMREFNLKTPSLDTVTSAVCPPEPYEVKVSQVVGVFCDPKTFPSEEELQTWMGQGVIPVIGLHPTRASSEEVYSTMEELLKVPGVAGLGEVGLDHHQPPEFWVEQILKLQRVLTLLKPEHVLVLHARSMSPVADEAIMSLMFQLQAHPNVSKEQLIHLHCFTGSTIALEMWLQAFPNTYFGLTSAVDHFDPVKYPDQTAAVRSLNHARLLLETDAPYFAPLGCRRSTPGLIGMTAVSVGRFLGIPWNQLLQLTNKNADRLYVQKMPPECV